MKIFPLAVELNPKHMHYAFIQHFKVCVYVNTCNVRKQIDLLGSALCVSGHIYYPLG